MYLSICKCPSERNVLNIIISGVKVKEKYFELNTFKWSEADDINQKLGEFQQFAG